MILVLVLTSTGLLFVSGCSDNPQAKANKEVREQTTKALDSLHTPAKGPEIEQGTTSQKDYAGTRQKVIAAVVKNQRASGLTKDSALLASGNLALAEGQQRESELGVRLLPIRQAAESLERLLRDSEELLLEKERLASVLDTGDKEIESLEAMLNAPQGGVKQQLAASQQELADLKEQKAQQQKEQNNAQAVLDSYQSKADLLIRQAELAQGDERLNLEQQGYKVLQSRTPYYMQVQAAENLISLLDNQMELVQLKVDNLTRNIEELQQRINTIDTSDTRITLKGQMREIEQNISVNQQRLSTAATEIQKRFSEYETFVKQSFAIFEEAIEELGKIRSGDAAFPAKLSLAGGYHHAGLVCTSYVKAQREFSERFTDLVDSSDPAFLNLLSGILPVQQMAISADQKQQFFGYFDKAVESYETAYSQAPTDDARCSVMKSKVLAIYQKMRLADALGEYDMANEIETLLEAEKAKGNELGVCFTQSETLRVIEQGLDYIPDLPMNLDVLAEGLKTKFSGWKRLPVAEQEIQVDQNLVEIDELISKYGQELAQQLEPLKQEMLAAKERGFQEPAPGTNARPGDPNSF